MLDKISREESRQNLQIIKTKWESFKVICNRFQKSRYGKELLNLLSLWYMRCLITSVWILVIYTLSIPVSKTLPISQNSTNESNLEYSCLNASSFNTIPLSENCSLNNRNLSISLGRNDASNTYSLFLSIKSLYNSTNFTYRYTNCSDSDSFITVYMSPFIDINDSYLSLTTLALLVAFSAFLGYVFKVIFLPPMVGMVLAGVIFTHTPREVFLVEVPRSLAYACRSVAIAIVLGHLGLSTSHKVLKQRFFEVFGLALIPSLIEVIFVSLLATFLLQIRWEWACMAGAIVAAVGPNIVAPLMLRLKKMRYSSTNGLPDILISASHIEIILILFIFFIFRAVAFSSSDLIFTVLRSSIELLVGVVYGVVLGFAGWPVGWGRKESSRTINQSMYFIGVTLLSIFSSLKIIIFDTDMLGAGVVGVFVTSIVCSLLWRKKKRPVAKVLKCIRQLIDPLIFGLIGYEFNFVITSFNGIVFVEITCIVVASSILRCTLALIIMMFAPKMRIKEKILTPIVWVSKATIQALFGSLALDSANSLESDIIYNGRMVLYFALLVLLLTSPIGYVLTYILGTRLLVKELRSAQKEVNALTQREINALTQREVKALTQRNPSIIDKTSMKGPVDNYSEKKSGASNTMWTVSYPDNYLHQRKYDPTLHQHDTTTDTNSSIDPALSSYDRNYQFRNIVSGSVQSEKNDSQSQNYCNIPLNSRCSAPPLSQHSSTDRISNPKPSNESYV